MPGGGIGGPMPGGGPPGPGGPCIPPGGPPGPGGPCIPGPVRYNVRTHEYRQIRGRQSSMYERVFDDNFSFISSKTICCDPSSEPSYRDNSDKESQYMFLGRINKNNP